jgi:ribosome biogenesis protein BRX1
MASILKHSKGKGKAKAADVVDADDAHVEANGAGSSSTAVARRKDKVLMLSSRGVTGRMRHLMQDLEALLPHIKKGKCEGGFWLLGRGRD